ncbi:hypothetical protein [Nonomuraea sp. NPDC050783]|uniref:hypothetical protein n=1 Tax=Nonomuraea sp. NPDC050783 TaxID=3154634 RepID=UPI0034655945
MTVLLLLGVCAGEAPRGRTGVPESAVLDLAEQLLVRDCMKAHGFQVWLIRRDELPVDSLRAFPYAVTDLNWAKRHGYGGDQRAEAAKLAAADPNKRYFDSLSPSDKARARAALNGAAPVGLEAELPLGGTMRRSDQGCVSQAERRLYGDLRGWYRAKKVVEQLTPLRVGRVMKDPRFGRSVARWSACMRAHGHPYADPAEARQAALPPNGATDRAKEIAVATAEAACAAESGLTATIHRLDRQYEREISARYRPFLDAKRALELAALPRAREIAGDRQP